MSSGMRSGVNFMAAAMFPLIFIFPCMKIIWGLATLLAMLTRSWSIMIKVASGLVVAPSSHLPAVLVGEVLTWGVLEIDSPLLHWASFSLGNLEKEDCANLLADFRSNCWDLSTEGSDNCFTLERHVLDINLWLRLIDYVLLLKHLLLEEQLGSLVSLHIWPHSPFDL